MSEEAILAAVDALLARPRTVPPPRPRAKRWKVVRQPAVLLCRLHRVAVTVRMR